MIRTLVTLLVLAVVGVAGVGFYRGWFTVTNQTSDADGHKTNVNLTVDRDKIQADADAVKKEAAEILGKGADPAAKPAPSRP